MTYCAYGYTWSFAATTSGNLFWNRFGVEGQRLASRLPSASESNYCLIVLFWPAQRQLEYCHMIWYWSLFVLHLGRGLSQRSVTSTSQNLSITTASFSKSVDFTALFFLPPCRWSDYGAKSLARYTLECLVAAQVSSVISWRILVNLLFCFLMPCQTLFAELASFRKFLLELYRLLELLVSWLTLVLLSLCAFATELSVVLQWSGATLTISG